MNYTIPQLPQRDGKPRQHGLTMAMDKGLSLRQAEDLIAVAGPHIDLIKLGWSTSYASGQLREKLAFYKQAGIATYFGGTLFEVFVARGAFRQYQQLLQEFEMKTVEVSDGSLDMKREDKLAYIRELAKDYTVLSEVGSKDSTKVLSPNQWVEYIKSELDAGSRWVIAEARESGTVGLYRATGEVRSGLIEEILAQVPEHRIIFEAPKKEQQVWFIQLLGTNVNLGNIAPEEVIPLETLRLGLRGDTFHQFLGKH